MNKSTLSSMGRSLIIASILVFITFSIFNYCENKPIDKIKIGYSPLILNLPLMVAHDQGYFEKLGAPVVFETMGSTNTMRDAVTNGAIDFAAALGTEMFFQNNSLQQKSLYALYFNVITEDKYIDAIIVNSNSDITTLKDLNGKNIGCYNATTVQAYLNLISEKSHIVFNSVPTPPNEALQLLSANRLDAYFVMEPMLTIALKTGNFKVIEQAPTAKYVLPEIPVGVYVVNGNFASNHNKTVIEFQKALDNAVKYIEQNPDQAITIGEKFLKASAGQYKGVNLPKWMSGKALKHSDALDKLASYLHTKGVLSSSQAFKEFIITGE